MEDSAGRDDNNNNIILFDLDHTIASTNVVVDGGDGSVVVVVVRLTMTLNDHPTGRLFVRCDHSGVLSACPHYLSMLGNIFDVVLSYHNGSPDRVVLIVRCILN